MATVHPIGQTENDSERRAIAYLAEHLPDNYHIFHNLELLTRWGLPYEYDLIVVGEYAVYNVEVKGYQGHIRGNAEEWEFIESGAIHRSPIPLTNKKSRVLASRLKRYSDSLNRVWVQSVVVLTDKQVKVNLNDDQADCVLHLEEAADRLRDPRFPVFACHAVPLVHSIRDAILSQFGPLHRKREIGEYRVLETVGKNDLYTLFLAEHRLIHTDNRFALKVYSFNVHAEAKERSKQQEWLLRDANALRRLAGHPNVVRAHPPFPWRDNQIVLPLDWIEGYSLRSLLDTGTEMRLARKVDIARQVGEGLCHAHTHGVIHRDVRPDNIIIPHQGPLKLVNFDCARIESSQFSTIGSQIGRRLDRQYEAPEVWENPSAASTASDQYALGAVLFELLTGQPICQHKREITAAKGLPRKPTRLDPTLNPGLDDVVIRMCAFRPTERYASIEEALQLLSCIE